ncbi:HAAS signaling domain-containing protein [Luedemannella helvata]|uniref:Uncharacterized protein n=1 Tax=Luedemannella helvata TaxID=349315 RepID=A0ABN2K178_9ACTN
MSTVTSPEVSGYLQRVRAALADLPTETREELLEDEPAHLAEVLAESGADLEHRLGPPESYAAELRAAAGLPAATGAARKPATEVMRNLRAYAERADRAGGRLLGYPRVADLFDLLRPGWWVLRGYLVGLLILVAARDEYFARLLPVSMDPEDALIWLLLVGVCVIVSVRLGRATPGLPRWGRFTVHGAGVLIVALALANLAPRAFQYENGGTVYYDPFSGVTDVYPYDVNNNPLDGVRLYDQNGNPIQIGDYDRCHDYTQPMDADMYRYPLCPPVQWQPGGGATEAPSASPGPTATP